MTATRFIAFAALACALIAGVAAAQDKPAAVKDGKTLFLDNKCNGCHTIQSQAIVKKKAEDADAKEEKSEKKPPDLSAVGLERKAPWMSKYLMKTEAIKGEKHGRKFRGTEAELATLTTWLETLKTKAASTKTTTTTTTK
jgi:mono/diheme cytochrome c family protein